MSSVIARWSLDGNGYDATGAGRDLWLRGDMKFAQGLNGNCFEFTKFDGSQYAMLPHGGPELPKPPGAEAFNFGSSDFSISFAVRFGSGFKKPLHTHGLIEKFMGSNGPGWSLELTVLADGATRFQFHVPNFQPDGEPTSGDRAILSVDSELEEMRWYHVVLTREQRTFVFYLDCAALQESVCSSLGAIPENSAPLMIGRRNWDAQVEGQIHPLIGAIDEVAVYKVALSHSEVQAEYARLHSN